MKKERSSKGIYARFAIIILVCAALGAWQASLPPWRERTCWRHRSISTGP